MEPSETELEQLLRSHLSGELDMHRGQAVRAFKREVTRPMERRLLINSIRRSVAHHRPTIQRWASMGLAMAACTALGFYLPHFLASPNATPISGNVANATPASNGETKIVTPEYAGFERTTVLRHVDEGSGLTPEGDFGRRIKQQKFETVRFTDPKTHEQYEVTIPSEDEMILPLGHQ
jgi:hypothetical protein